MNFVQRNATRLMAVAVAVLALVAFYVPTLPDELILGVIAAVLGAGDVAKRKAAPQA